MTRVTRPVRAPGLRGDAATSPRAATGSSRPSTPTGPEPAAGQFYMLATESGWGGGRAAPTSPAPSRSPTASASAAGCGSTSWSTAVGPGTERLLRARASGERLWITGPLGRPFSPPADLTPRRRRARSWSAAASASLRSRSGAGAWQRAGIPTRVLLGFRDRERLRRPRPVRLQRDAARQRGRPPRATAATSPTCSRCCSRATTRRAPPSTPAARRRCSRRCARSAPSAASPASSRWRRRWPAASGPASAAPSHSRGGYMRLCVDGPGRPRRRDRDGPRRQDREAIDRTFCGIELAHPVINGSGTFDAIAARRAFGDELLRELPLLGLRLQDDHPRAAGRQPAAAALGDALWADQLDRAAEQGPRRLPRLGPAASSRSFRCR